MLGCTSNSILALFLLRHATFHMNCVLHSTLSASVLNFALDITVEMPANDDYVFTYCSSPNCMTIAAMFVTRNAVRGFMALHIML